jgi:hypothetical protein
MQQIAQGHRVAARSTPTGVGLQCAAQVVKVVHQQVHPHVCTQSWTPHMHTQGIHRLALKSGDCADLKAHPQVNKPDFRRLGIVTKKLNKEV